MNFFIIILLLVIVILLLLLRESYRIIDALTESLANLINYMEDMEPKDITAIKQRGIIEANNCLDPHYVKTMVKR